MLKKLFAIFDGDDALVRAAKKDDVEAFAELFGEWPVLFLNMPDGSALGMSPDVTEDEALAQIKDAAKDLTDREEFQPFCATRNGKKMVMIFSNEKFTQEFAKAYVAKLNRIVSFQVLGVTGQVLVRSFGHVDGLILNHSSSVEVQISDEKLAALNSRFGCGK